MSCALLCNLQPKTDKNYIQTFVKAVYLHDVINLNFNRIITTALLIKCISTSFYFHSLFTLFPVITATPQEYQLNQIRLSIYFFLI